MTCRVQVVAAIAHACGQMRHCPSNALLESVEQHVVQNSSQYSCADWSALIQAFTQLQVRPRHLYSALLQEVCPLCLFHADCPLTCHLIARCDLALDESRYQGQAISCQAVTQQAQVQVLVMVRWFPDMWIGQVVESSLSLPVQLWQLRCQGTSPGYLQGTSECIGLVHVGTWS